MTYPARPTIALAIATLLPAVAPAALLEVRNGDPGDPRYYLLQAYAEIKSPADQVLDQGGAIRDDSIPTGAANENGNLGANGTGLNYGAFVSHDAFGYARTSASMQVSSHIAANGGYNVVASAGSRTQAQFSSQATPGQVVFTFAVSGTESEPFGTALHRLDFLARPYQQGSGSFFDVFAPEALHELGPGTFQYTYTGSTANPLDILFYSASAVIVGLQDPASRGLPANGASFTAFADYAHTVNLTDIDLFTASGDPITEWAMTDAESNALLFTQDGRVSPVPVPAALWLFGTALAAAVGASRRRAASTQA